MARNRHAAPDTAGGAQHEEAAQTIHNLRGKIEHIDELVQMATDAIDAFAHGAKAAIQSGDDVTVVYRLLDAIIDRTFDIRNTVNSEAEEVDANHRSENDPDWPARSLVSRRWRVENASTAKEPSHA